MYILFFLFLIVIQSEEIRMTECCHPEERSDEGSRVHPRYTPLCVPEILRFAQDDKKGGDTPT